MRSNQQRPDPTPKEIRDRTAEIRKGWSARERYNRRVFHNDSSVEIVVWSLPRGKGISSD